MNRFLLALSLVVAAAQMAYAAPGPTGFVPRIFEPIEVVPGGLITRFDGEVVGEDLVDDFVRGDLLTWDLCDADSRNADACVFWFTERRARGAVTTFFMTETVCGDPDAKFCRNGYEASLRSRVTYDDMGGGEVAFTQKVWQTYRPLRAYQATSERLLGHVEGTLTEDSYDLAAFDGDGDLVDTASATIEAAQAQSQRSGCDVAWESSLAGGAIIGSAVGASTGAAASVVVADMFLAIAGSAGAAGGAILAVGAAVATPAVVGTLIAVTASVAIIGAAAIAINHWCDPADPDPNPPRGGVPGGPG